MQLYVISGNGERRLLRDLGEGAGIEPDVGVLNLAARRTDKVIVAMDASVIAKGLPVAEPELGHLPGLGEQGEHPIDGRRSHPLDPFAYTVKDLARRGVVI